MTKGERTLASLMRVRVVIVIILKESVRYKYNCIQGCGKRYKALNTNCLSSYVTSLKCVYTTEEQVKKASVMSYKLNIMVSKEFGLGFR